MGRLCERSGDVTFLALPSPGPRPRPASVRYHRGVTHHRDHYSCPEERVHGLDHEYRCPPREPVRPCIAPRWFGAYGGLGHLSGAHAHHAVFHQYYDVPIGTWMVVSRIPSAILALIATVFGFIGLHARGKLSPAAAVGAALGSAYLMLGVADILGSVILAPLINTLEF